MLFVLYSISGGEFATNESIQCTEVYEYAQTLRDPAFRRQSLQLYKFAYALRLVEAGMTEKVRSFYGNSYG